ncbi:MBL fold metallo-hydrolase [Thaumasiovibrio subtropicus]|uniref:MBL fold metallo-hydrolase n=1 Tax=Thaumasiovibrio subtropicus TaxID=1891207 RepID=UPI000B34ACF6|nr:MBL fold metallo-hydrolase [Thaumasiovibrio subtropicus]
MPNGISVRLLEVGHCTHPGFVVNPKLGLKPRRFPAGIAVIRHPSMGVILFDTGYHQGFFDATRHFPEKCYAMTTPCHFDQTEHIVTQLTQIGIEKSAVRHIVLSHFHADHIAAVCEFPEAILHCHPRGIEALSKKPRWKAVRKGYLNALLPASQRSQCHYHSQFSRRLDEILKTPDPIPLYAANLDDDHQLYLVNLPGHAAGHLGLLIRLETQWLFLVADACWLIDNLRDNIDQHWIAGIICDDRSAYQQTLQALRQCYHTLGDKMILVPSHCSDTLNALKQKEWMR